MLGPMPADAPAAERIRALQDSPAFETLRDHGCHLTSISPGYTTSDVRAVDDDVDAGTADVFEMHLLGGDRILPYSDGANPAAAPRRSLDVAGCLDS